MPDRDGVAGRFVESVLRVALRTWPASRRHDRALIDAFLEGANEAGWGRARLVVEALVEAVVIVGAGVRSRFEGRGRVRSAGRKGGGWSVGTGGGAAMGMTTELRGAMRSLGRKPGFALSVLLTLALGVGANSAVLNTVDRALLTPLPFTEPDELVVVWNTLAASERRLRVSAPDAGYFAERATTVSGVAFMNRVTDGSIAVGTGDTGEHVRLAAVTANLFTVLGVEPVAGRGFVEADGEAPIDGAAPAVLVSHELWTNTLGAAPATGSTVLLNGRPASVVGVLPPGFSVPFAPEMGISRDVDVWVPFRVPLETFQRADGRRVDHDSDNTGAVIARLRPGVPVEQARAEFTGLQAELRTVYGDASTSGVEVGVGPLRQDATRHLRPLFLAMLVGVALLLLVASLNLSTLVVARSVRRQGELALRAALGASRGRVVRLLALEAIVLGAASLALGVVVARLAEVALRPLTAAGLGPVEPGLGAPAVVMLVGSTGVAMVLFLLAPLVAMAREGGLGAGPLRGRGPGRLRGALLAGQVAASVVLLLGVGVLRTSADRLGDVDPGFEPGGALAFSVSVRVPGAYRGPADRARLMLEIESAVAEVPGVRAVGLTGHLPLSGRQWTQPWGLPGQAPDQWWENRADFRTVTAGYFEAMGVEVEEGRTFIAEEDRVEARRVVVIDRSLAERIAPGGTAVGRAIGIPLDGSEVQAEVVGVVPPIRHESLARDGREAVFVPYRQEASRDVSFVVRTQGDPAALVDAVRTAARGVEPRMAVYDITPLQSYVERELAPVRLGARVVGLFALLATLAVGLGLYGLVSLEVARRTRDIGLRLAIGARPAEVVAGVVAGGLRLALYGALVGGLVAAAAWRLLASGLYGVGAFEPVAWLIAFGVTGLTVLAALFVPALGIVRMDPTTALRSE